MRTVAFQGQIDEDGKLRLELPVGLPPGSVEGVVVVHGVGGNGGSSAPSHKSLAGILKGVLDPDLDVEAEIKEIRAGWKKRLEVDP